MCGSTLLIRRTAITTWTQDTSGVVILVDQKVDELVNCERQADDASGIVTYPFR